ncbi:MAG TPA: septum formation initiator family protein [Ruminiclostridium sp.]
MKKQKKFNLWTLIIIASICYFTYTVYHQQINIEDRRNQYAQLQKDVYSETINNEQLLHQKSLISTDEFAEKIAREKLGYVKDGEKIYIDTNK